MHTFGHDGNKDSEPKGFKLTLQERTSWREDTVTKEMIQTSSQQQDFVEDAVVSHCRLTVFKYNNYAKVLHFP